MMRIDEYFHKKDWIRSDIHALIFRPPYTKIEQKGARNSTPPSTPMGPAPHESLNINIGHDLLRVLIEDEFQVSIYRKRETKVNVNRVGSLNGS